MKISIYGNHTAPYGDFPYDKGYEFERALKNRWPAVMGFAFNCIDGADIFINGHAVADMTTRQVYVRLNEAVQQAASEVDWNIWSPISLPA